MEKTMNIIEGIAGTAVAEPSTQVGRRVRIAINGLGRIGRTFLKLAIARSELEIAAVNDIGDAENLAYLLRFDSVYGRYDTPVAVVRDGATEWLMLGDCRVRLLHERDPSLLPWKSLDVDIVIESTGVFETYDAARAHIAAGADRVVLTAPAKDDETADARTILVGVNTAELANVVISSNGSCTTNSASPVVQVLDERLGVLKALLNTVHGYTATQRLVDSPAGRGDFRRGRAAAANIVPSSTGAAIAVTRAIPSLANHFDGLALRVPVCRVDPSRRSSSSAAARQPQRRSTGFWRKPAWTRDGNQCSL
jgi:glyceraldehyde 3-phosphate dehydrogenase